MTKPLASIRDRPDHDELAASLAAHLRTDARMTWCDLQLGPAGSPRPDVYTLDKSFVRPNPTAYEVKVSRSDFLSDVTSGKWQAYLQYAGAVVFACESGLLSRSDVPHHCGLMLRSETGWRAAKKPVRNVVEPPFEAMLKLLIDGVQREGPRARARAFNIDNGFSKRYGSAAARWVADAASVERTVAAADARVRHIIEVGERTAKGIIEAAQRNTPEQWRELCEVLGLPTDSNIWNVRDAITSLRRASHGNVTRSELQPLAITLRRVADQLHDLASREDILVEETA